MKKSPSIYLITSPTNKVYIGQTLNTKKRMSQYKGMHCKNQVVLYNSIKKYLWVSHSFKVLIDLPIDVSQKVLNIYEQFYMDAYAEAGFTLMNLRDAGSNGKMSDSTKIKMGNSRRGKTHSEETKQKMRGRIVTNEERLRMSKVQESRKVAIIQKTLSGEVVKEWPSFNSAASSLGLDVSTLRKVCLGLKYRKTTGGFNWSLKDK